MEVILLQKVANLGALGDKVRVKNGYARNYLIPRGKATTATPAKIAEFEARRAELEKQAEDILNAARARAEALASLNLVIAHKAGDEGRLFGSVGAQAIAEAAAAAGLNVDKQEIRLPHGPFRHTGDHVVNVSLHADVSVDLSVKIVAEA